MKAMYKKILFCVIFGLVFLFNYIYSVYLPYCKIEEGRASLLALESSTVDAYIFRDLSNRDGLNTYNKLKKSVSEYNSHFGYPEVVVKDGDSFIDVFVPISSSSAELVPLFSFNQYGVIIDYGRLNSSIKSMGSYYDSPYLTKFMDIYESQVSRKIESFIKEYPNDDDFRHWEFLESLSENNPLSKYVLIWGGSIPYRAPRWIEFIDYDILPIILPVLLFIDFMLVCFCISNIIYLLFCGILMRKRCVIKSLSKLEKVFVPISLLIIFIGICLRFPICYKFCYLIRDVIDYLSISYYIC